MNTQGQLDIEFTEPSEWQWGYFQNARGTDLRYGQLSTHENPVAHVVYVEGLSEFAEKTFELSREFNNNACNFSVYDRHGQGLSGRYLADPDKQHSQGIEADVDDLIQFCRDNIPPGEPIVLCGHSTGGLIALTAMEREPELFKTAILTSPLLGVEDWKVKGREAFWASLPLGPFRNYYAPGCGPWTERNDSEEYAITAFTNDPHHKPLQDYWMNKNPDLRVGGPTFGWVQDMCAAIVKVRAQDFLDNINQPILVLTAENDQLVDNSATENIVQSLAHAEIYEYQNAGHEIWMEVDTIRKDAMKLAMDHIHNVLKPPPPQP